MSSKNIGIREEVYEHLKAHKRGNESFSDVLERLLDEVDANWHTHFGFLSGNDGAAFEQTVTDGLDELDNSLADCETEIEDTFNATNS